MSSGVAESSSKQNSGEEDKKRSGSPGANRHQLVQRLLDSSSSLPAFINDLLTTQAVTVAGTEAAGFLLERSGENQVTLRPIAHIRPDESPAETRAAAIAAFQDLIKPCVEQGRDGAIEVAAGTGESEPQYCLVTLLRAEGEVVAASAVIARCINTERARQRLMSMQLVAGYFELFTLRRNSDQARMIAQSHQHVLQLATSVATAEGFESAGMNLCNELATRAHATRVSLGWVKGTKIKVVAISHTEQFDKKQELSVHLQRVMEECMDQEAVVQFDPAGKSTDNVTREAQALSRTQGGHIVLSLPLRRKAEVIGVVTLEFLPQQKIGPQVANGLGIAVDLLAPQLYDRYQNDRYIWTKIGLSTKKVGEGVIGPKHMIAKLVAVALVGVAVALVLVKPMYRVAAPFTFVPKEQYKLVAPEKSRITFVQTVVDPTTNAPRPIKPGDRVTKDQILVQLDVEDLVHRMEEAQAAYESQNLQARAYLGQPDKKAESDAAFAEAKRYMAQVKMYQGQIERLTLRAPRDGVILSGDLAERAAGGPVDANQELLVIGEPTDLEVELNVGERDIQNIRVGQAGAIGTNSLPGDNYDVVVRRIVPMGNPDAKAADNTFKVYCAVTDKVQPTWRPGMTGEARMDVEPRPLYWLVSHKLVDYVKLKTWF
ncbi:MAG TPA: HlyD family efflux transporter periplasmic adaptor subunit [Humisphaera sp.]